MENKFVSYKIALLLKQLGYNNPCIALYNSAQKISKINYLTFRNTDPELKKYHCAAPLWLDALDWLRVNYGVMITIKSSNARNTDFYYHIQKWNISWSNPRYSSEDYYQHLRLAIFKTLNLINTQKITHV